MQALLHASYKTVLSFFQGFFFNIIVAFFFFFFGSYYNIQKVFKSIFEYPSK